MASGDSRTPAHTLYATSHIWGVLLHHAIETARSPHPERPVPSGQPRPLDRGRVRMHVHYTQFEPMGFFALWLHASFLSE